ncbi:MAG TPA: molybdopterin-dependent oxidoreductase [Dehalococcoidia bacterium]|nr:molybdopterin-dependent oxidoreductase [Dehalococcoidia bacterium]
MARHSKGRAGPNWANPVLLALVVSQLSTGFVGLTNGSERHAWLLWLHGIGAYAIVLLLAWKGRVILGSLRSRRAVDPATLGALVQLVLLLVVLGTGLVWTFGGRRLINNYSLITIHVVIVFGLTALLPWHVFLKRWVFRDTKATGRRNFLRFGAMAAGGLSLWLVAGRAMEYLDLPGSRRRFTGSYETGSFSAEFPIVTWLLDYPAPVDAKQWSLVIDGAVEQVVVLTYEQLSGMARDVLVATIDCTGGWYAHQEWKGVNVGRLLEMARTKASARSVSFEAVSGYGRRYSVEEANGYLLALEVAGSRVSHGHGFPVRLVAPEHRGFEWVKWIARIRVNETSKFWQPPVPLQ